MPATLPIKAFEILESKFGKEDAIALINAFEFVIDDGFQRGQIKVKEDLTKELATKSDINEVKTEIEFLRKETKIEIEHIRKEMKTEIEKLRLEMKTEIANCKTDIIKRVAAMLVAQAAAIATLVKLL